MEMEERQDLDLAKRIYNPVIIDPKAPDITATLKLFYQYNKRVAGSVETADHFVLRRTCGDLDWRVNLNC